ncbi:MAG TPA: YbaY family lipoprotein [Pyrinomonadaceae bacterium]|nr:YbaY family lipoprotein [Pyrinomonadaceae bacterium]
MKQTVLTILLLAIGMATLANAQQTWLDRSLDRNWNTGSGIVPRAPRGMARIEAICQEQIRQPVSPADRAVTQAGWFLFGASQTFGNVTLVTAMAGVDGMCRPTEYNAFVFVGTRFAGTLSPTATAARSDGSLGTAQLTGPQQIWAEFARYSDDDALCCPSRTSTVQYSITTGARPVVMAEDVMTTRICRDDGLVETQDSVVSGTVTYRQRMALPRTAVLTVKIVDVSRQDVSSPVIAEQRIETAGKQVPFSFDIAYDRSRIQERNRYAVQAEIRDGSRLLFITDTSYPVITQNNPRNVEITVVPVGGGGGGPQRGGQLRGTVTYRQRIALPANSEVIVRLIDAADPMGPSIAETSFSTGTRQVPFSFELPYDMSDIDRQRNYELRAEIRSGGQLRFRSETGVAVNFRGQPAQNTEIVVVPATDTAEPINGKTFDLSKFGTGSIEIGTRSGQLIVRANVSVTTNGNAVVTILRPLSSPIVFNGKLTYFDESLLRITVESSGNADAGGEIEVRYSGSTLRSLNGNRLTLDGQAVQLTF